MNMAKGKKAQLLLPPSLTKKCIQLRGKEDIFLTELFTFFDQQIICSLETSIVEFRALKLRKIRSGCLYVLHARLELEVRARQAASRTCYNIREFWEEKSNSSQMFVYFARLTLRGKPS